MSSLAAAQPAPLPLMPTWPGVQDRVTVLELRLADEWQLVTVPVGEIWKCKGRFAPRSLCSVESALVKLTWSAVQPDGRYIRSKHWTETLRAKFKGSWCRLKHAPLIRNQYVKMPIGCGLSSQHSWEECAVAEDAHTSGKSQRRVSQCGLCLRVVGCGFKRNDVSYRAGSWLNGFTKLGN